MATMASSEVCTHLGPCNSIRFGQWRHITSSRSDEIPDDHRVSSRRPPFVERTKSYRAASDGADVPLAQRSTQPSPNTFAIASTARGGACISTGAARPHGFFRSKVILQTSGIAFLAIARLAASRPFGEISRRRRRSSFFSQHAALSSTSSGMLATTPILVREGALGGLRVHTQNRRSGAHGFPRGSSLIRKGRSAGQTSNLHAYRSISRAAQDVFTVLVSYGTLASSKNAARPGPVVCLRDSATYL